MERTISVCSDRNIRDQLWRWSTVTGLVISVGRTEKKVCEIKVQLYKSPWESAYYLSETCRRYLTKAIYQLSWNEYSKAWLNTNWLKHQIYLPYSSRKCFESFEYSEKRFASIHKNFFTFTCVHRLSPRNRIPTPLVCVHYAVLSLNKNHLFRWISYRPVLNLKASDFFLNFWS